MKTKYEAPTTDLHEIMQDRMIMVSSWSGKIDGSDIKIGGEDATGPAESKTHGGSIWDD